MLALLGANPWLGLKAPDWRIAYLFLGVVAGIGVFLYIIYGARKLREQERLKQSSWKTYYKIAKLKGLSPLEADALAEVIRRAKVKRPSQVLGTIQVFDRCVEQAVARGQLDANRQVLLAGVRQKLLSVGRDWDGNERRHPQRAVYPLPVQAACVTREELEDQQLKTGAAKNAEVKDSLAKLFTAQDHGPAQVMDLSAGGLALLVRDDGRVRTGDYLHLAPGAELPPVNLSELIGEVVGVERMRDQEQLVLHLRFLPYPPSVKKEIIRLVYEKSAPPAKEKAGKPATTKMALTGKTDETGDPR